MSAALFIRSTTESRAPAELATTQWQRLQQKIARAVEKDRHRSAGAFVVASTGPSAPPASTASRSPFPTGSPAAPGRRSLPALDADLLATQSAQYEARRAKSVIELQQFRRTYEARISDSHGRGGNAVLINLNPRVNFWYLLQITWDGRATASYHLTNSRPESHDLLLNSSFPAGLLLEDAGVRTRCELWSDESPSSLAAAARQKTPYVTLCDDEVVLRRPTAGRRTKLEWATDFLRDNVWGGEQLTTLVRDNLYNDAELVRAEGMAGAADSGSGNAATGGPLPARVAAGHASDRLTPVGLGLALETPQPSVRIGTWNAARDNPGVFVGVMQPGLIESSLLASSPRRASPLDAIEAGALTYLVAFDLARFEIDYAVGTEHPRVGWSERARPEMRDGSLPGPDGIANIAPLVAGGIVPYSLAERTVASFAGGFKRSHGAFSSGALALRNSGSHYGFIESGVVLSKLQPGLATIFVLDDGAVRMKTWTAEDDALLERIQFARQNGVPLVEKDPVTDASVPGALVSRWGDGNWSGSEDRKLRSVRAGICLQESAAGRYLLYGYFSSATPSAMARVFQSYGCSYAMITDMNALEHTYLALYRVEASRLAVDHLVEGMSVLDKVVDGQVLPRFLGFADNRDFFYVVRRQSAEEKEIQITAHAAASAPRSSGTR